MLSERIGLLRHLAGDISNRELDRLADITPGHSWALENKPDKNPELRTLEKISMATGCLIGWLAAGEGRAPTEKVVRAAAKIADEAAAKREAERARKEAEEKEPQSTRNPKRRKGAA